MVDKQESIQQKWNKLFNTVTNIPKKIADAVEEGKMGNPNLICVQDGVLDFDLIEDDVRQIHRNLKARGDIVLGSHLILYHTSKLMEIVTYTERGDQTFSITVDAQLKKVINIPQNIRDELQQNGRVELSLKI
ncbi:MAG: hypothetical protein QNJ37_18060 [Crocosphaera sp.]|nr:hypothetical protein [Crocosphaera sp.]